MSKFDYFLQQLARGLEWMAIQKIRTEKSWSEFRGCAIKKAFYFDINHCTVDRWNHDVTFFPPQFFNTSCSHYILILCNCIQYNNIKLRIKCCTTVRNNIINLNHVLAVLFSRTYKPGLFSTKFSLMSSCHRMNMSFWNYSSQMVKTIDTCAVLSVCIWILRIFEFLKEG